MKERRIRREGQVEILVVKINIITENASFYKCDDNLKIELYYYVRMIRTKMFNFVTFSLK